MTSSRLKWRCVAAAVFLICGMAAVGLAQADPAEIKITLLQLNDVYQISPIDRGKNGGLARVATLRKKVLKESPNTLFFLGGDTISPSVASTIFRGAQMIASWNALGLDYAVLGNHEFDFGDDVLRQRMQESKFVWLGSNVFDKTTGKPFNGMPSYVIREIAGVKLGIIGLLTTDTAKDSSPSKNIRFDNPIQTLKRLAPVLRQKGATVIVLVSHLTMTEDKLVAGTGLVDVVLGGHDHEFMQAHAGRAPIFKWGSDARILGRIDLHVDPESKRLQSIDWVGLPVTDAVTPDAEANVVIGEYEKKISAALDAPIGSTTVDLDALQVSNRNRETNLGDMVADAFRQALNADIALINGGSVRGNTTYPVGPLSKRDMLSILPFENPIVKVEATGAQIKAALENGVSKVGIETEFGGFPQISGLTFEYDARKPVGARVVSALVNNQPLDEKKTYTLASSVFLLKGGNGYGMFSNVKYLISEDSGPVDAAVLGSYVQAAGTVAPKVEGRIKRLDQ